MAGAIAQKPHHGKKKNYTLPLMKGLFLSASDAPRHFTIFKFWIIFKSADLSSYDIPQQFQIRVKLKRG